MSCPHVHIYIIFVGFLHEKCSQTWPSWVFCYIFIKIVLLKTKVFFYLEFLLSLRCFARIWVTYTPAGVDSHISIFKFMVSTIYMSETSVIGETNSSLPHKPIRGRYLRVQYKLVDSRAENTRALVFISTSKLLIRLVTRQYCFKLQENFPLHIPFIMEYVVHRLEDAIFFYLLWGAWNIGEILDGGLVGKSSPTNFCSCPNALK